MQVTLCPPDKERNQEMRRKYENANERDGTGDIYSKSVRAGRRTYFFDVKATKDNDWFLVITESRRIDGKDGVPYYEKHKIFLYKEDFVKFGEGLNEIVDYIRDERPELIQEKGAGGEKGED